jgi:hypothetical protein
VTRLTGGRTLVACTGGSAAAACHGFSSGAREDRSMMGLRSTLLVAAAALAGAVVSTSELAAQESTSVTGCLAKSDGGTFSITGDEGASYELSSSDVQLEGHQGHKVTITGTATGVETGAVSGTDSGMARDTSVASDTGMAHGEMKHGEHGEMEHGAAHDAGGQKAGTLNVTGMTMVSATCN